MDTSHQIFRLDLVRETICYKHYSLRTEQCYVEWIRHFGRYLQQRHPEKMGASEIRAFLGHLAAELKM